MSGTNLAGATVVISGTDISVVPDLSSTAILLKFKLVINTAAATGLRTITISNSSGTATATANFPVNSSAPPPTPSIDPLSPTSQLSGATVEVHGKNIHFPSLAPGAAAAGTAISLTGPGPVTKPVPPGNIIVLAAIGGNQRVSFIVPNREPAWAVNEIVTLQLSFGPGGPVTISFRYDD